MMAEKINSLYKPQELVDAQQALIKIGIDPNEASDVIIKLFKDGYRIVKIK